MTRFSTDSDTISTEYAAKRMKRRRGARKKHPESRAVDIQARITHLRDENKLSDDARHTAKARALLDAIKFATFSWEFVGSRTLDVLVRCWAELDLFEWRELNITNLAMHAGMSRTSVRTVLSHLLRREWLDKAGTDYRLRMRAGAIDWPLFDAAGHPTQRPHWVGKPGGPFYKVSRRKTT